METLLDGPAYHTGVQSVLSGDMNDVLPWIKVIESRPYKSLEQKQKALELIASRLKGFVVTADPPLSQLVPELMELYPNAKVIVTTRDKKSWAKSMELSMKLVKPKLQRFIFYWLGGQFTYLPQLWTSLSKAFSDTYGTTIRNESDAYVVYDAHYAWLKEIVPKDKLFYFDVKDGWEPLCKALNVPVPEAKFPHLNDAKSYEEVFKGFAIRGLLRWAAVIGIVSVLVGSVTTAWMRRI